MEYKIQNIVFPTESKHQLCKQLFYRGENGFLDRGHREVYLGEGQNLDFTTYLNACSYQKWRKYTNAGKITLHLDVQGQFQLCAVGYSKDVLTVERTEYAIQNYELCNRDTIRLEFPENDNQMLGFEISSKRGCTIYGGYYTVEVDESDLNHVCLSLATTTCRKEQFIVKNIEMLKKEILELDEEIKDNIYIHVVDNGRTLTEKDIFGKHVFLHPNSNAGGAGGFARGMIESLHQEPEATHVLLMDDDVLVLPESIMRTYHLLRLLKDEYRNHFISGAMLYYEEPNRQHEDIGTVNKDGQYVTLKPHYDHDLLTNNLDNEMHFVKQKNQYAGWWYCCIPATVIKKFGLPLPLFIRWDDSEYSLRCKAEIITMNGICIWHMGFSTKYNAAMDQYQQCRNFLIDKACSGVLPEIDAYSRILKSYRLEMLKFNYGGAELVLRAFRDYLKGPKFLKINNGEKILKENIKLNEKLIPLDQIEGGDIQDVFSCFSDEPRTFMNKWLYRLTYNGHRGWPSKLYKRDYEYVSFDCSYQPEKMALHNKLIAVNPFDKTGVIRTIDKKRYRELQMRFKKLSRYYRECGKKVEESYRREMPYLTSEKFWRKYLGI